MEIILSHKDIDINTLYSDFKAAYVNRNQPYTEPHTALFIAMSQGFSDIVDILVSYGAKLASHEKYIEPQYPFFSLVRAAVNQKNYWKFSHPLKRSDFDYIPNRLVTTGANSNIYNGTFNNRNVSKQIFYANFIQGNCQTNCKKRGE